MFYLTSKFHEIYHQYFRIYRGGFWAFEAPLPPQAQKLRKSPGRIGLTDAEACICQDWDAP